MRKVKGWEIYEEALKFHYLNKEWVEASELELFFNELGEYLLEHAPNKALVDITEIMRKYDIRDRSQDE
jgi:hypothetical protein